MARKGTVQLSQRELEILRHVADGETDAEIAGALVISRYTVAKHVGRISAKLRATGCAGAAVAAIRRGIIE